MAWFGGTSGGARPPEREERDGGGSRRVCGTSPSGWASAGNIKAVPSFKNSAPHKIMRTHAQKPVPPPLQKDGEMGIISLWCSYKNCCAEWLEHSYRAAGCWKRPAACRIYVSVLYCTSLRQKLQEKFCGVPVTFPPFRGYIDKKWGPAGPDERG